MWPVNGSSERWAASEETESEDSTLDLAHLGRPIPACGEQLPDICATVQPCHRTMNEEGSLRVRASNRPQPMASLSDCRKRLPGRSHITTLPLDVAVQLGASSSRGMQKLDF